jgi:inorganic pyrophosphatase
LKTAGAREAPFFHFRGLRRAAKAAGVAERSPFEGDVQDIQRLPARAIKELEEFFVATNALEAKTLKFLGWRGPAKAIKTIKKTSI